MPIDGKNFNSINGITTNPAEGLNFLLKLVLEHKIRPLDVVCLALLQLSIFYCNEIKLGFGNKGNYKLDPLLSSKYQLDSRYILTRQVTDAVDVIKNFHKNPDSFMQTSGCLKTFFF